MDYILTNATVYTGGSFVKKDLAIIAGKVCFSIPSNKSSFTQIDCLNKIIIPGFVDVHVHLRQPGFCYKETIETGTKAGAKSGYSAVCSMPNLNPVPDSKENLKVQQDIIDKDAVIRVYPYGSITKGQKGAELVDFESLANGVIAFTDDGKGVQTKEMMKSAMLKAKALNKMIVAHCEDESLLNGGYIHDGEYAKNNGHKGISSASEYVQVERDLKLAKETGVKYHVCHVSALESVQAIRKAKSEGVDVTAETGPHYLVLNDMMLKDEGGYKMNPPIRAERDRLALLEGIKDGTIDMIATDHAPHSQEEKGKGLKSLNGIVGLETAFPIIYTKLVKTGEISLEKAVELMSINPAKRFNIENQIKEGLTANLAVFDIETEYEIDPDKFVSKGKSMPFKGERVFGECLYNFTNGKLVYKK